MKTICQSILIAALGALTSAQAGEKTVDAPALIAAGVQHSLHYSFDLAEKEFAEARAATEPGSEPWLQASLGLAVALHHRVPLSAARINEQAVPLYEEVFAQGGRSLLAARAALNRGRAAQERDEQSDTVDTPTAQLWYRKVIDGWPEEPIAGEATLRLAVTYIESFEPEAVRQGIALAEARAQSRPNEIWASSLWLLAGDSWWTVMGNRPDAIRCLLRAEEAGLPDPSRAWIPVWRIACLAELENQNDVAIEHFKRIITKYPASGKGWEAQQRLRALGVEPPQIRPPLDLGEAEGAP
jgi:tetratricopeptide (TPR) repeat protein